MQNFRISCQNGIIYAGSCGYMVVSVHARKNDTDGIS